MPKSEEVWPRLRNGLSKGRGEGIAPGMAKGHPCPQQGLYEEELQVESSWIRADLQGKQACRSQSTGLFPNTSFVLFVSSALLFIRTCIKLTFIFFNTFTLKGDYYHYVNNKPLSPALNKSRNPALLLNSDLTCSFSTALSWAQRLVTVGNQQVFKGCSWLTSTKLMFFLRCIRRIKRGSKWK